MPRAWYALSAIASFSKCSGLLPFFITYCLLVAGSLTSFAPVVPPSFLTTTRLSKLSGNLPLFWGDLGAGLSSGLTVDVRFNRRCWINIRFIRRCWINIRFIRRCWINIRFIRRCWLNIRFISRRWLNIRFVRRRWLN